MTLVSDLAFFRVITALHLTVKIDEDIVCILVRNKPDDIRIAWCEPACINVPGHQNVSSAVFAERHVLLSIHIAHHFLALQITITNAITPISATTISINICQSFISAVCVANHVSIGKSFTCQINVLCLHKPVVRNAPFIRPPEHPDFITVLQPFPDRAGTVLSCS